MDNFLTASVIPLSQIAQYETPLRQEIHVWNECMQPSRILRMSHLLTGSGDEMNGNPRGKK